VAAFCEEQGIACRIYLRDEIWFNDSSMMGYGHHQEKHVQEISKRLCEAPYQIFVRGKRETELLVERFGPVGDGYACNVVTYYDGIPEVCILHPESTKGKTLAALCESWGVSPEGVMALGDSSNDLPMIEWAGIGVAMGWAPERVRERADMVTAPDNPAGVAEAIYYVLEKGKAASVEKVSTER
jgi:hydroxymethylpyrimidine pyrophosphatase-like HAD family hydrolase